MLEKGTVSDLQDRLKYLEERLKVCPRRARQKTTSVVPGALRSRGAADSSPGRAAAERFSATPPRAHWIGPLD